MSKLKELSGFDRIYSEDLLYISGCWKLCGNANCCGFSKHKSHFNLIGRQPFQALPLLPGEYKFLERTGLLKQFGEHDHKITEFNIDGYVLKSEELVVHRSGCICEQDTRTTVCRLYPLMPRFDINGRLIGAEPTFGIYEEMERIAEMDPVCKITSLPFDQLNKFLAITEELSKDICRLFYMQAYIITKEHVTSRLKIKFESNNNGNVFHLFEEAYFRSNLIDTELLRTDLSKLANQFESRYGDSFKLAMNSNQKP